MTGVEAQLDLDRNPSHSLSLLYLSSHWTGALKKGLHPPQKNS